MSIPHLSKQLDSVCRFWRLLCDLRIRHLLLLVFGTLSLIAISALGWNAYHVYEQYAYAGRMAGSNAVGEQALALNAHLARERGLTAALLANAKETYNQQTQQRLKRLRQNSDEGLRLLFEKIDQYPLLPSISIVYENLTAMAQRLDKNRKRADLKIKNSQGDFSYSDWSQAITERISEVAVISRIVTAPVDEVDHAIRFGPAIKEAFFNYSENAGRDRALIGAAIAQQRPFTLKEYEMLSIYQHTSQMLDHQISEILVFFPHIEDIVSARKELQKTYKQEYQKLRTAVIDSSRSNLIYPVNAAEWFDHATDGVNAILNFSHAIDLHISDDIEIIKSRARNIVLALFITLMLVVVIFVVAFMVTYQRILIPLRELVCSANTIANGNFSRPIRVLSKDEFGDVVHAFEIMRTYLLNDREKRQKAEDELRKLSTAIEQSVSSIVITNIQGVTEYVNPQFHLTTGYEPEEVIGKKFSMLGSGETPISIYEDLWVTINKGQVWQGELLNKKKNGELYWDLVSISPVRDRDGKIAHLISIQNDITERKALEEQLNFMAYHDELTDLPNRTLLADRFKQLTTHAQRADTKVALLILDLDRFKLINDTLGHRIGDQLLIEVARRLKRTARSSDTIARYGGDEFVILANEFASIDVPDDLAIRLVECIREPIVIEGHHLHVSVSIGISLWPDDGGDMDTLLRQADAAMYHAKDLGRGQFQFFTEELNQQTSQRLRLENDLRDAIDNQEFEIYYQPQVHLGSGRIIGVEALIRWNHPEFGLVSPDQFIPLAEDTRLIRPIGEWVLRGACKQITKWKQAGHSTLSIAINVSVHQLDDDQFLPYLNQIIAECELDPDCLEIEITESAMMSQPEKMLSVLNSIKKLGVKLALDDFGTGYSSLSYLRRFPFDKLKIDRSFIRDIANKPEDAAITQAISEMAHHLNMTVLGEGVETDIQAAYMRRCGCDEIQGYLVSRPVPAADFEALLKKSEKHVKILEDNQQQPTVLVVDGNADYRKNISMSIQQPWLNILETENGHTAMDILATTSVDVIIADYHLPDIEGVDLLNRVQHLYPGITRITLADDADKENVLRIINRGIAHRFLLKSWNHAELRNMVLESFQQKDSA